MREILSTQVRKFLIILAAFTVMVVVNLSGFNKLYLLPAVGAGYLLGLAWYGILLSRLMRSTGMTVEQAKKQMVVGLILRLALLGIALGVAIHVSFEVFITVVSSFFLVYVLALVLLMVVSYKQPWDC